MLKPYLTVEKDSICEIVINKSRFIGRCFPVNTEEDALLRLKEVRVINQDATHNCYAYSIRPKVSRFSDDGEPGGTAGLPIMEIINSKGLNDCIIIVTRYFGGILLGAGGLVRAYSRTASEAAALANTVKMLPATEAEVTVDYSRYGIIEAPLRAIARVNSAEFLENVTIKLSVLDDDLPKLIKTVADKTDGRAFVKVVGSSYIQQS